MRWGGQNTFRADGVRKLLFIFVPMGSGTKYSFLWMMGCRPLLFIILSGFRFGDDGGQTSFIHYSFSAHSRHAGRRPSRRTPLVLPPLLPPPPLPHPSPSLAHHSPPPPPPTTPPPHPIPPHPSPPTSPRLPAVQKVVFWKSSIWGV